MKRAASATVNPAGRLDVLLQNLVEMAVQSSGDIGLQVFHGALKPQINGVIEQYAGPHTPHGFVAGAIAREVARRVAPVPVVASPVAPARPAAKVISAEKVTRAAGRAAPVEILDAEIVD